VEGPFPDLAQQIRDLHRRFRSAAGGGKKR
jgi:hypothetical protein